ncbi:MAG TPA: hypothetical protein VHR45_24145 [Thermoanaerobaculia bacterium]|nr:hypothetical protein [Thermoanaerobaculia bacterium]
MFRGAAVWFGALPIALIAGTTGIDAQAPKPGGLFSLSTCFGCQQRMPAVAGNGAGDFMTVWEGGTALVAQGVFGRPFDPSARPRGGDFQVQQAGRSSQPPQFDAAVATDAQGNFVIAWSSSVDDISSILAQRFDPAGTPLGSAIEVASDPSGSPTTPSDSRPAVAGTPDGGFAVAWVSLAPPSAPAGSPPRVMLQRFDSTDATSGPRLQLSTGLAFGDRPSVCVSATGRVVAAWTFADAFRPFEADLLGVAARRVSPGGVLIDADELEVAPAQARDAWVGVSCGRGNTFVVAWHSDQAPATSGLDVVAQRFTRRGRAAGSTFLVNQIGDGDQRNPVVFHDAAGNFTIVWESQSAVRPGIRGRRFAIDGTPLSSEFPILRVAKGLQLALRPAAAATSPNSFVVVWDNGNGVYGRQLTYPANIQSGARSNLFGALPAGTAMPGARRVAKRLAGGAEEGPTTGNGQGEGGLW